MKLLWSACCHFRAVPLPSTAKRMCFTVNAISVVIGVTSKWPKAVKEEWRQYPCLLYFFAWWRIPFFLTPSHQVCWMRCKPATFFLITVKYLYLKKKAQKRLNPTACNHLTWLFIAFTFDWKSFLSCKALKHVSLSLLL